jgi:hypothetical protein
LQTIRARTAADLSCGCGCSGGSPQPAAHQPRRPHALPPERDAQPHRWPNGLVRATALALRCGLPGGRRPGRQVTTSLRQPRCLVRVACQRRCRADRQGVTGGEREAGEAGKASGRGLARTPRRHNRRTRIPRRQNRRGRPAAGAPVVGRAGQAQDLEGLAGGGVRGQEGDHARIAESLTSRPATGGWCRGR